MKQFLLLLLSFTIVTYTNAQKGFEPGSITLNSNETLEGKIDISKNPGEAKELRFSKDGSIQTYSISDVKAFELSGKFRYERHNVSYNKSATDIEHATEFFDGPLVNGDRWLEVLYKSKYSMFGLETPDRNYYFIQEPDGSVKELRYRVKVISGVMQKDESYKTYFSTKATANNNSELAKAVALANYDEDDLLGLMMKLNGEKSTYNVGKPPKPVFEIRAGVAYNSFNPSGQVDVDGYGAYALYEASFKGTAGFLGGVGFTFFSRKSGENSQLRIGLNISSLTLNGLNDIGSGSFDHEKYTGTLLMCGPEFSYQFALNKRSSTKVLLGPAFGYNLAIANNTKGIFDNPGVHVEREKYPEANGGQINMAILLSVVKGKNVFTLRALHGGNIYNSGKSKLSNNSIGFTYGYMFKK